MANATQRPPTNVIDEQIEGRIARMARRSFTTGAIAALAGGSLVTWLATRPPLDGAPWPLRRMLEFNERVAQMLFSEHRLAPEYPITRAVEPRVNGNVGLQSAVASDGWTVRVIGKVERHIPLAAIQELPAHEMTTELKCVEGWSRIVHWKGVRFTDFLSKFGAASDFVGLSTPPEGKDASGRDDRYFVGFDRPSIQHPQTLLCYEMNGKPLTPDHGAPLRLISTVKYGYKCLKRLSAIELTDVRPPDYWAQRGYDWYAGH